MIKRVSDFHFNKYYYHTKIWYLLYMLAYNFHTLKKDLHLKIIDQIKSVKEKYTYHYKHTKERHKPNIFHLLGNYYFYILYILNFYICHNYINYHIKDFIDKKVCCWSYKYLIINNFSIYSYNFYYLKAQISTQKVENKNRLILTQLLQNEFHHIL